MALDACAAAGTAAGATQTVLTTQRAALRALGLSGRRPPLSQADRDPAGYLTALRLAAEEAELTDPAGLGGFGWLVQAVGVPLPGSLAGLVSGGSDPMERMPQSGRAQPGDSRGAHRAAPGRAVTSSWAAGTGDRRLRRRRPGGQPGFGHPSGHGMLRLRLTLDGERIVTAEPVIGYVHRGAEKLFEARDYRQIIVLANRHDWLSAFSSELGVVLAAERLAGIEVPPRAVWARTLLAELNRVLSHLAFLGCYPPEVAEAGSVRRQAGGRAEAEAERAGPRRPRPGNSCRRSWKRSPAAGCTTCSTGSAG